MRDYHGEPSPYRLITTDDPTRTLGQGAVRYFRTLVQAANAFVNGLEPQIQAVVGATGGYEPPALARQRSMRGGKSGASLPLLRASLGPPRSTPATCRLALGSG
jgi:hypothetical protein